MRRSVINTRSQNKVTKDRVEGETKMPPNKDLVEIADNNRDASADGHPPSQHVVYISRTVTVKEISLDLG